MKTTFLKFAVALALAAPASWATAALTTLDFEGLTSAGAEDITSANQGYGGLTWTTGNNWTLFAGYPTPALSGSYGLVNNFGVDPAVVSGSAFDFAGVSIIGWSFNAPSTVGIRGFDAGNVLVGDTGAIAINTSSYTYLQADFLGVTRLEFYGGKYFALDDFELGQRNNVSVPGTLWLGLLGLGLTGASLRQRRSARG